MRGIGHSRWGYFLRAETMNGLLTWLEQNPGRDDPAFHERSHGQAFDELLGSRLAMMARGRGGLLVLDEPEAGLSFTSQLSVATQLAGLWEDGIQVSMVTHTPVLAAVPGALLLELGEQGFTRRAWHELTEVGLWRRFLDDPSYFGMV